MGIGIFYIIVLCPLGFFMLTSVCFMKFGTSMFGVCVLIIACLLDGQLFPLIYSNLLYLFRFILI